MIDAGWNGGLQPSERQRLRLLGAYYSCFLLLGMITAVLGPSLIKLAEQIEADLPRVSVFFPLRAGSYLIGSWWGGRLFDRMRGHRLLGAALGAAAAALILVPLVPSLGVMAGVLIVMGLSMGLLDVGCNTLLLWSGGDRPGPVLNGLHFFYGLGTFIAPLVIALAFRSVRGVSLGYWVTALLIVPVLLQLRGLESPAPEGSAGDADQSLMGRGKDSGIWPAKKVLLPALFLFFYVGVEVGFGGWLHTYTNLLGLETEITGAYLTSVFWGTFTLGRLLGIPLSSRLSSRGVLTVDLLAGLGALAVLVLAPPGLWVTRIMTAVLGLALASIFPTTLALAGGEESLSARASSWFFVSAGLGAVVIPWLTGRWLTGSSPATFPAVMLICLLSAAAILLPTLAQQPSA